MNLRNIFNRTGLTGILFLGACDGGATAPGIGSISGRVMWDLDGDGTYESSPYAIVTIAGTPYWITGRGDPRDSSLVGGGLRCEDYWDKNMVNSMCAVADSEGNFFIGGVPEGRRKFYILNLENPNIIGGPGARIYGIERDLNFFIEKNSETKTGNIRLEEVHEIR